MYMMHPKDQSTNDNNNIPCPDDKIVVIYN